MSDLGYGEGGGTLGGTVADGLGNGGPAWSIQQGQAETYFNQAMNIALTNVVGINPNTLTAGQRAQLQNIINGSPYLMSLMTSQQAQESVTAGASGYQVGENVVTYLAQAIESTLFPSLGSSTSTQSITDPAAATAAAQWKAQITNTPQTTQALYQEELLAMGLPADLYTTYSSAVQAWEQYFAAEPDPQQLVQLLGIQVPTSQPTTQPMTAAQEQQAGEEAALGRSAATPTTGGQQGVSLSQTNQQGQLSYAQLEGLVVAAWNQLQPGQPMPTVDGQPLYAIMAAIVYPESGANPSSVQQGQPYATTGWGLWQITPGNSESQYGTDNALLTPMNNALAAVSKYLSQGLGAWTTYTGGEYEQYLQTNVAPDDSATTMTASTAASSTPSTGTTSSSVSLPNPATLSIATIDDEIRNMPSNIPGLNMGQYSDLQSAANSVTNSLLGHTASDGLIASLSQAGATTPAAIELYLWNTSMGAVNAMGSEVYNNLYQANQPTMQNVYNDNGFDPSIAVQQYEQYYKDNPGENPLSEGSATAGGESQTQRQQAQDPGRPSSTYSANTPV